MSETYNPHLKALLIGINYHNKPQLRLQGCANDAALAKEYLTAILRADPANITTLVDPPLSWEEGKVWSAYPTKENIVHAASRILANAEQGDVLLLHFSGHGTQIREQDGTIIGEALVPLDAEDTGTNFTNVLRDTELERLILEKTPPNVTLYIVLDCCYGGGDIEKLGTSLPYSRSALGTHVRAAVPRNLPSSLLQKRVETGGEGYKYPSMESRLRAVASAKPNVVVFVGGSKFEPVVEATFNFMGYGVFSYSFYQTLKENKYLRNINIINSIQMNIRNAGFFQQPQLIAAREEICVWNFLSSVHGDENTNIISPSFANASRMMDARQIQEWQTIDSIATLEVNHELGMHRKRAGKWVPFVVEDIARIIAGVAGRTILKIVQQAQQIQHQQEGLVRQDNNTAFALALTAIKDAIHRVLEILVPSPSAPGAKRPPLAYPPTTMQDLVRGVVLPAVRGAIQSSQLPASAKSIDVEAVLRDGFIVPNANAALSQHVGRAIYLADELRDIPVAAPDQLPETRELIDHALELAKQVIVTIAASEIYTTSLSGTPSAPDVAALANDIANRLGQAFNNDFVSRLISSPNPQRKIEKLCLDVLQGLVRDYKVALYSQDLADRVAELTTRFSGFVSLSTPVGHALLRARRKGTQTSAVALAATLTESICACAVDDAVFERAHQQAGTPPSVLAPFPRIVPDLVKVAAHSVAELATHAVLDVLSARNAQNISTGALCGVLQSVAKTAAARVLDTLGTMRGEAGTWNWGSKGESSWNSYFYVTFPAAFASIAVDSALVGLRSLAVRYPGSLPKIVEDVEQLIKNYVNASLPRFLRFLPSLGLAIPLINAAEQALGSPQGRRTEEWAMANHGAEVLATSLASIAASRDASIDLPTATSIVKEAVAEFVLKMHENSIVANATESLQHALKKRNGQLKRITHSTLQDEVSRSALLFAPFSPASIPSAHTLFDVSAVFAGTASRATQQCAQLPTGREGEVRVSPPFFVNFGRLIAQVAAGALLDVLQKQGVLTDQPKVRHLSKRIKNAATNIAVQLLSDTLAIRPTAPAPQVIGGAALPMPPPPTIAPTAPGYTTMLDQVVDSMVPAVAKAARSIIGTEISASEIALNTAAAQAVATRMRFMGNMLPILSTVSPPMLNNVTGLISTALAQRGKEEGTAYESDVERAGLTMMMALCENRDILQYKSGNVIDDVITQAVERAIQYARENRTGGSVEQAVKRAIDSFEFKGEGTRYLFEESLRPIATQVSQVAMRIPPTIAEELPYASKTKGLDTLGLGQVPSTYLSSSDVERITQQVLSLYSFAPGFSDKSLRPIVAQTVSYVAHYNQLAHYPRNFVLELAKMAGCVAAREHLRPGANPKNTVTLGLAVVAQLLIPATSIIRAGPATE